ncbi:uncharacterized protein LOC122856690 isoform X2 [Aphidius gifuensis]|nr:uncharacterized protein LOC122856690 isoform X2 [Aphidius gifuensis]
MKPKRSRSMSPEASSSRGTKIQKISDYKTKPIDDQPVQRVQLLDFSDDVILNIMKYLNPQDLMSLSLCCHLLNRVGRDRTVWHTADFRSKPMPFDELRLYLKYFHPTTSSISINGKINDNNELYELKQYFLKTVCKLCTSLKELIIEEYKIISTEIKISDFPTTLETLSLKGTNVCDLSTSRSYFFKLDQLMPNLTTLILTNCQWLTGHSLMVISKIPKLKELRINSCKNLGECVAYASLSTRFGFKTLEKLDLRCTAFGDSELRCFGNTTTLTHIYLEYSQELNNQQLENRPQQQLGQPVYEDNHLVQYVANNDINMLRPDQSSCRITDRSICALGSYLCDRRVLDNAIRNVILVEEDIRVLNNPNLTNLVLRNFSKVTNQSLIHLAANADKLKYLDVTGSGVTAEGVRTYTLARPDVTLISSYY